MNYQVEQAKIAIATGGIMGKGPGKSTQRNFLPHPYSDFIYAIIVEEYGMFGGLCVLGLYLLLLFRFVVAAHKANSLFGKLVVVGLDPIELDLYDESHDEGLTVEDDFHSYDYDDDRY